MMKTELLLSMMGNNISKLRAYFRLSALLLFLKISLLWILLFLTSCGNNPTLTLEDLEKEERMHQRKMDSISRAAEIRRAEIETEILEIKLENSKK